MPDPLTAAPAATDTTGDNSPLDMIDWYERALPLVERLVEMAREWHDAAAERFSRAVREGDAEQRRRAEAAYRAAIELHSEFAYAAIRLDLRLAECRRTIPKDR